MDQARVAGLRTQRILHADQPRAVEIRQGLILRRAGDLDFPVAEQIKAVNIQFNVAVVGPDNPVVINGRIILAVGVGGDAPHRGGFQVAEINIAGAWVAEILPDHAAGLDIGIDFILGGRGNLEGLRGGQILGEELPGIVGVDGGTDLIDHPRPINRRIDFIQSQGAGQRLRPVGDGQILEKDIPVSVDLPALPNHVTSVGAGIDLAQGAVGDLDDRRIVRGQILRVNVQIAIALILPDRPLAARVRMSRAAIGTGQHLGRAGQLADLRQFGGEVGVSQWIGQRHAHGVPTGRLQDAGGVAAIPVVSHRSADVGERHAEDGRERTEVIAVERIDRPGHRGWIVGGLIVAANFAKDVQQLRPGAQIA